MFDLAAILLLIAADPEPPVVRVIKMDPALREAVKAQQQAEAAAANDPRPEIVDPMMGLGPDDYPAESLRANEDGNVRIAIDVDAAGKATRCTVIQSSGHTRLDEKTCQVGMERAVFRPARDAGGKPVASVWRSSPVAWRIPRMANETFSIPDGYHATTIQISADGTLGECTIDASGGMSIQNACEQAKSQYAKNSKQLARWWKSLTLVVAFSSKEALPNFGKPAWGSRQGRVVSAQLLVDGPTSPVSCETILSEGWAFGGSACPPPDRLATAPADTDWSKARNMFTESSTYGQLR